MSSSAAPFFVRWRFLGLTMLICAWLLLMPVVGGAWRVELLLEACMLITLLVTVWANPNWSRLRNALIVLWLVSISGTLLSIATADHPAWRWSRTLELLTLVPLMGMLAGDMLAFVLRERTLTFDSIFATIAAYLLVAGLFTQIYMCLLTWNPASFSLPSGVADRPVHLLQADMTYFSLVTLATVGYGDVLPATSTARMLAMIQAVTGQFYIAVVVAIFVGAYSAQRRN
ncbi:MAG: potassium channel family protein [Steroidobacteraceae bacterium]